MEGATENGVLRAGDLEIRPDEFVALAEGRRLGFTGRELKLLEALARRPDRVVSRDELAAAAWNRPLRAGDRSVDVYIARLRAKLEQALPGWCFVHTHFGFGYRFSPERLHLFHRPATRR